MTQVCSALRPRRHLVVHGGQPVEVEVHGVVSEHPRAPGGADRGGHALKRCHQFLIAMSGSFDVILDDGTQKRRVHLSRSYYGLHIPPMLWREMDNFSSGSVCLVLASECYSEGDYFREYSAFDAALKNGS